MGRKGSNAGTTPFYTFQRDIRHDYVTTNLARRPGSLCDPPAPYKGIDPDKEYTKSELDEIATSFLWQELKQTSHDDVLFPLQFKERYKREVYTTIGTPDAAVLQGMYWKTHPYGRRVNSEEQRRNKGRSFYR